ncbi:MAG: hypothetical protein M3243_04310 [Thermoproteota archaeon]|nr:hypothetical protein [Thermoproteota archaeon]
MITSHSVYVIILDRYTGEGIDRYHEYGDFDIYNDKRIYRIHRQFSDSKSKHTTTTSTSDDGK